jgi:L,D-transpeptidase ErfK/SrfK
MVTVTDQPIKAGWIGDRLYIEAHPSLAQTDANENMSHIPDYELTDQDMAVILKKAGDHADRIDWARLREAVRERKGYPIEIADLAAPRPDASAASRTDDVKEDVKEAAKEPAPEEKASEEKAADEEPVAEKSSAAKPEGKKAETKPGQPDKKAGTAEKPEADEKADKLDDQKEEIAALKEKKTANDNKTDQARP